MEEINVAHIAKLSNLTLSSQEKQQLASGFKKILKTISNLNQLKTAKIKSTFQVTGLTNIFRSDEIDKSRVLTQKQALSNAKSTLKGYFLVPGVLNET